jgi:hypothetical protein
METLILTLEIFVSVMFFGNKVFIFFEKPFGWTIGSVSAFVALFYFYLVGFYIFTALAFGLIFLMGYGSLRKKYDLANVENVFRLILIAVMGVLTLAVWDGGIVLAEYISSIAMLGGTYYLTHNKVRLGWFLYAIGNGCGSYVAFMKPEYTFALFQALSVVVSIFGWYYKKVA